jgi:hypothetical protein
MGCESNKTCGREGGTNTKEIKKLLCPPSLITHALLVTQKVENSKGHHGNFRRHDNLANGDLCRPDNVNDDKLVIMSKILKDKSLHFTSIIYRSSIQVS